MEALPLYSPLFSEHLLWYRTVLDVVGNKLEEKNLCTCESYIPRGEERQSEPICVINEMFLQKISQQVTFLGTREPGSTSQTVAERHLSHVESVARRH